MTISFGITLLLTLQTVLAALTTSSTGIPSVPSVDTTTGPSESISITIIRTTRDYASEESFFIFDGEGIEGAQLFAQPALEDNEVYTWTVSLHPGVFTVAMGDEYGDGWGENSNIQFVWNGITLATVSQNNNDYMCMYTLVIPTELPTQAPADPLAMEVKIVRSVMSMTAEESFRIYEGESTSGTLVFTQPSIYNGVIHTWTTYLRPGVYTVEMTSSSGFGWGVSSNIVFYVNNVYLSSTTFGFGSSKLYTLTIPNGPIETPTQAPVVTEAPTQPPTLIPPVDPLAVEVTINRKTTWGTDEESFNIYEGEGTSGTLLVTQPSVDFFKQYTWVMYLRPGIYTVEMTDTKADGWVHLHISYSLLMVLPLVSV